MLKRFLPFLPVFFFVLITSIFFAPLYFQAKLPIPADTVIGLYHPFRDLYAKQYPRGIPFKNSLITDPVRQEYPWRLLAIDVEKSGLLPLWNPYTFAGSPLLANMQSAAFYPLNILFFLLPFSVSWSLLILLQQVLAGIFLYLYLRKMKLPSWPAVFGSIVFAFGGFFIGWLEWNTLVQVAIWLPLILLAKEHLLEKMSVKWTIVFVFAQCAAFFAGHLQTFFYLLLIHEPYIIARIYQESQKEKTTKQVITHALRKYWPFILLGCCIFLITAIQWIPTTEFIFQSGRDVDQINSWRNPGWFIPWQNSMQFLAPDFFGNPATMNYWGVWNYGEFIGYIGVAPLLLALFALFFRRDRKTFYFGTLFFLSLLFSYPTLFAKLPYLLHVPLLSTSQPTRFVFVTDFCLAVLAALGLDFFIRTDKKKRLLWILAFVFLIYAGLWLFVLVGYKLTTSLTPDIMLISKRNLYFPSGLFIASIAIFLTWIFLKNKKIQTALLMLLVFISIFDLLRFAQKFTPFTNPLYLFPQTRVTDYLQQHAGQFRIMELDPEIMPPNFSVMYHLQSVDGYDPLYLRRYGELIAASERGKPDIAPPFGFNRIVTPENINSNIINLLGVKYILSLKELQVPNLLYLFSEGQTKVYENTQVFPRAYFLLRVRYASDKNAAIQSLFDSSTDLRTTAIVEDQDNSLSGLRFANGSVDSVKYSENSVALHTTTVGTGFLVLTDSYYPSWHAKICSSTGSECRDSKIYVTDYNFRGVMVPPGEHTVIFYDTLY